jgi:hypothetical protein
MLGMYHDQIVGPAPSFPPQMEQRITRYLQDDAPVANTARAIASPGAAPQGPTALAEVNSFLQRGGTVVAPATLMTSPPPRDPIKHD